ncbi:hypothetical protein [Maricaulis sp.]|uniref:HD domain-containing protein n=1 Tax=unclassified Maricaulis TaxID=2632371 RepID=UPI001B260156|nr:hypothetical protein [Maricaulis sp.]MBO6796405.1 metal-dependent phosphohydrolase [Maricaulis sp.]
MAEPETALRERWALQMTQLGWRAGDSQIDGIITAYSEPHRRYHGLSHLAHIFDELDRWHTELQTPERCWMAAWYHDIIYDPKGAENEALSAERAARELPRLGAPTALVDDVRRLILATADHQSGGRDRDDALFLDIDFSILGAPDEVYDTYAEQIRKEYSWAPDDFYREGRAKFLDTAQARQRTFVTDEFETRLGARARANMRREISTLEGKL